jgi:peroxiredoxin Q/BCP
MITVGRKSPAFTLKNQDDEPVKLSDFAGRWVVLYFYPKDDTPGCTQEACEFTEGIAAFRKLDAVVLGCSPDAPARHRTFVEKYGLEVTLLSDPTHAAMEKYDAWGEKTLYGRVSVGVRRSTVIIDPAGKVAHHWRSVKAAGHAEYVRRRLAELRC